MKFAATVIFAAVGFVLTFAGVAAAQTVGGVPDGPGLYEIVKPVLQALVHGHYLEGAALALVLAAALARRYGAPRWPWLATDTGGAVLVFWGSLGGAVATALAAGGGPSLALVWTATKVAFGAAGGYSMAKRLAVPLIEWTAVRSPAWLHPLFDIVLWIFGRSAAVAKAEAAGAAAVAASPAAGAAGVVGERHDVE